MMKNVRSMPPAPCQKPSSWHHLFGIMRLSFLVPCASFLVLSACTSSGAIQQLNDNTYQITHTMGRFSPTTGVRAAITEKAQNKCAKQNQTYAKVREEMGFASGLSYTLIFQCNRQGS